HVRQAGSYVGPDKLRFDFTHGQALTEAELEDVENLVNDWVLADQPVHALTTTLEEARRQGAMALFGEKYGDVVRMVEVGDGSFSRELCGGTHVRLTAEIGVFKIIGETSSAANVRRIEAITGPAAVDLLRRHDRALNAASRVLRTDPGRVADEVAELRQRVRQLEREGSRAPTDQIDLDELAGRARVQDGVSVLVSAVSVPDGKALLDLTDRLKGRLGDAAIVLGSVGQDRVDLIASVAPAVVARGVRANQIVALAAQQVGGGGGGRDTLARAGGKEGEKLPQALAAAHEAITASLAQNH
ncbi:MAG TPA: DHHA1 domain-containing protein, partial [Solirubrobacteraceae bacterium]|nr:DHHA1 domain-containing protein [Solirubrobacteraceae bacterium]